jgi:hypothetical protein
MGEVARIELFRKSALMRAGQRNGDKQLINPPAALWEGDVVPAAILSHDEQLLFRERQCKTNVILHGGVFA